MSDLIAWIIDANRKYKIRYAQKLLKMSGKSKFLRIFVVF